MFNMPVRDNESNPYYGADYLIRPKNIKVVNAWL